MTAIALRRARSTEHGLIVGIDEEAAVLFEQTGLSFGHLTLAHPFVVEEHSRWLLALERGEVWLAELAGEVAGFMVLGSLDGAAYLDQLSVLPRCMRRGVAGTLIAHGCSLKGSTGCLWLTTYAHLSWNRAYYERFGFVTVADACCGPELRGVLAAQRVALPAPEQRVAMRKSWSAVP